MFSFLYHCQDFYRLDCIYELQSGCLIGGRNCIPFTSTWVTPSFWWGPCYSSFSFSVLLFCFVCLPSVSCPTIALSIDYQCLISPSLFLCCYFALFVSLLCLVPRLLCLWIINVWFPLHFSELLFCFVCLPAVSCPTITLFMDYQCLISPSLFLCCYFALFVSLLCLVPRLLCL